MSDDPYMAEQRLIGELRQALPDAHEHDLMAAASSVRYWHKGADRLRQALVGGYAYDLDGVESSAEYLIFQGEALRRLVDRVRVTHPRARRTMRRRAG